MKKLLAAALAVVVTSLGLSLADGAPAQAGGRSWHTVLTFHHTKAQACFGAHQVMYMRGDNTRGRHDAKLAEDHTLNGDRLGGGSIDFIQRGTIDGTIGGTISDPANTVVHVKLKLYGGGGRKHRSFRASEIGSC
jgi:hypothetical protein